MELGRFLSPPSHISNLETPWRRPENSKATSCDLQIQLAAQRVRLRQLFFIGDLRLTQASPLPTYNWPEMIVVRLLAAVHDSMVAKTAL